jgi:hypothetical protein
LFIVDEKNVVVVRFVHCCKKRWCASQMEFF